MELALFYLFAVVAVLASLGVIGQRNPMHSVLLLIVSFAALAGPLHRVSTRRSPP